jgi:N-acetyl sugar amidotransferase
MMQYCNRCTYGSSAVNLQFDDEGICTSCRVFEEFALIDDTVWARRKQKLREILEETVRNNKSNYDCIVPVSGGKDSYYQTHTMIKEFGLKPLLVTYHGNNYLPEGDYNRDQMRQVFDADHIVFGPSVDVLKKLNRICFKKMGDMNWHAHCGIFTYPIQIAVKFNIPLIMWGEIAWDISGMYDPDDYAEFSARVRHEHGLRGFEWYDMLNDEKDKLTEKDLLWAKYPTDEEVLSAKVRGLYLGNFIKWDPNIHSKEMQDIYGWKTAEQPFERTYRTMSNLDDRYENGAHDLLKFIKFGYGRASDHTSKDIRLGLMTREKGIELVHKHDLVISKVLYHWLDYIDMSEDEFWSVADTFRDPRVWWIENGKWFKNNLWGTASSYGDVHLSQDECAKFTKVSKTLEIA